MAVGIEDILLARAMQDERDKPDLGTSALIGAGLGGTAGITMGDLAQRLQPMTQKRVMPPSIGSRVKPGMRMAGGLVGAILGGALGAGTRAMMTNNSPAANILAKLQVQGELNANDQQALQNILADTYSNTLSM